MKRNDWANGRLRAIELRLSGMTYEEIGHVYGVTRQRMQQILAPPLGVRSVALDRAGHCCEGCGTQRKLFGHHIMQMGIAAEHYDHVENVMILCHHCHGLAHNPVAETQSSKKTRE